MATTRKSSGNGSGNAKKTKKDFGTVAEYYAYVREQTSAKFARILARIDRAEQRALTANDPKAKIQAKIAALQAKLKELEG